MGTQMFREAHNAEDEVYMRITTVETSDFPDASQFDTVTEVVEEIAVEPSKPKRYRKYCLVFSLVTRERLGSTQTIKTELKIPKSMSKVYLQVNRQCLFYDPC